MIKSEAQYRITRKALQKMRRERREAAQMNWAKGLHPKLRKALVDASQSVIEELEGEIKLYDNTQAKRVKLAAKPAPCAPPAPEIRDKLTQAELRHWPKMSRAARWQLARIKQGLCAGCGQEPLAGARLGQKCLTKQRERMRKKIGAKRRNAALSYALSSDQARR